MQPNRSMRSDLSVPPLSIKLWTGPSQINSTARGALPGMNQQRWIGLCASRLAELRPDEDEDELSALALELWNDVGGYDPEVAAEMEHESIAASE